MPGRIAAPLIQLQPLQCGYPASPPSVGDYLAVADPLPAPSPGQGYYYVTAVNFRGRGGTEDGEAAGC